MAKKKKLKKVKKTKKVAAKKNPAAKKPKGEKVLGKVSHFFDKISVAAIKVLAPIKVGEIIHIKGHSTDFVQKIESMQIERQSVEKAKKKDEIGIKVKDRVREHDLVYLSAGKAPPVTPPSPTDPYAGKKFLSF